MPVASQPQRRAPSSIDRLPPHSPDAEQGVLGCILLDPNGCIPKCIEKLKSGPTAFYDLRHQTIYGTLLEMYDSQAPIDLITVQQRLKDKKLLEEVGGLAYLSALPDTVPSAENLDYYLDIVLDKFALRMVLQTCTETAGRIYDYEGEVDTLIDEFEADAMKVSQSRQTSQQMNMKGLVGAAIDRIETYHQHQGQILGLASGFADLDSLTGGFEGGEMIVIAARPSLGKTSLAMNIAEYVAAESKLPVGVFSLEMTAESLVMRMVCSRARVDIRKVREGFLTEGDFTTITAAAGLLSKAPIHIDDTSGLSILQLRAKARQMAQQHGIKLFVVDYMQLLHSTSRKADNRQQEISDISSGIKGLAKELKVPIIALSQLNRDLERDKGRKPRLSDLRESGSIEQDADIVGLLYRPGKKNAKGAEDAVEDDTPAPVYPVNLLIAKQRNGPRGVDVQFTFLAHCTRFEAAANPDHHIDPADVPPHPYHDN